MKTLLLLVFAAMLSATWAHAENVGARFTVVIDPSKPASVWRIDLFNGAVSRCEAPDLKTEPVCSPWSSIGTDQPLYAWDEKAQKIVPTNEAARRLEAQKAAKTQP